jgi:hypothetical protein
VPGGRMSTSPLVALTASVLLMADLRWRQQGAATALSRPHDGSASHAKQAAGRPPRQQGKMQACRRACTEQRCSATTHLGGGGGGGAA